MLRNRITAWILFLLTVPLAVAAAQPQYQARSEKVERLMLEANAAFLHVQESDLPAMEAALASGLAKVRDLVESYHLNTAPSEQARTNAYLDQRGWGHLVWTQIMVRLLAVRNGMYDRELDFAEQVALESAARGCLDDVVDSVRSFDVLLEAKDLFGFGEQIDRLACGLFPEMEEGRDYLAVITGHRERLLERQRSVLARLQTRSHPGVIEPDRLTPSSGYLAIYQEYRGRLQDEETRLDAILHGLQDYDPEALLELAAAAEMLPSDNACDSALDAVRVELMIFEDALDAAEDDPAVQRMLHLSETYGSADFHGDEPYDVDFRDAMELMHEVRSSLAEHADAEGLRRLYALGDQLR